MSRHWKPEGNAVRVRWERTGGFVREARRTWPAGATVGVLMVAAAAVGGAWLYYRLAGPREVVDASVVDDGSR